MWKTLLFFTCSCSGFHRFSFRKILQIRGRTDFSTYQQVLLLLLRNKYYFIYYTFQTFLRVHRQEAKAFRILFFRKQQSWTRCSCIFTLVKGSWYYDYQMYEIRTDQRHQYCIQGSSFQNNAQYTGVYSYRRQNFVHHINSK